VETKITKGDWSVSYGTLVKIGDVNYEMENSYDAILIAAAPKMYKEIKADIDWLNRLLEKEVIGSYFGQGLRARIESKKALLAEARGEKSDSD
jgi:hypothetical protein